MHWREAIERPGAGQMRHVRKLLEARPYSDRVPAPELAAVHYEGVNHIAACRGDDYAFVYSSNGLPLHIHTGHITGEQLIAHWYDPRTGEFSYIGEFDNQGVLTFLPPSRGRNDDWVLVLDDASKGYAAEVRSR